MGSETGEFEIAQDEAHRGVLGCAGELDRVDETGAVGGVFGEYSAGSAATQRAARRSALTITPFAQPGWEATPWISRTAESALKVSRSISPGDSPSRV